MQMMQLLASSGVTMAAGAMISLSFALSPPLTLLPPRSAPIDINRNVVSQKHQTIETVGAATADAFERRWQAASDAPLLKQGAVRMLKAESSSRPRSQASSFSVVGGGPALG